MRRREFLTDLAVGSVALGLAACKGRADEGARATVVMVTWPGTAALAPEARRERLEAMVRAGLERLSGKTGVDAWRAYVKPEDTVALKVNSLASRRPTSVDLADVVARGVLSAGVAGERCLVFDRFARELTAAKYTLGPAPAGYRVVATDQPEFGWDEQPTPFGKVSQRLSTIVSQHATALINLPVWKDHSVGGVTGALKNHCGNILQPYVCHPDRGDPYFADVAALPPIASKQRLVIGDALTVIYEGGPDDRPDRRHVLDSLVFSTDPVAHDVVQWQQLEQIRAAKGLRPLARSGRDPSYVRTAGDAEHKLGIAEPERIELVRIQLG